MTIRPQYHLRPGPQGLQAWDVRQLIALAAAQKLQPRWVPLATIAELDQRYWFTEPGDSPTPRAIAEHMKLVEAADTAYPVLLDAEGRLMDGMHRAVKRLVQGHGDIWALQFASTPAPHFVGVAADDLPYEE